MTTLKYPGLQKYDEKIKEWVANVTSPMVHNSGNENISGIKNFSESPLVPTPATTDNSRKSANTEWVRSIFSSVGGFSFGDDGKVFVDFSQMDPAIMRAVVTAMVLPGGGLASDEDTGNLYVDFDEMDPDIMREVVLSMVQSGSGLAVDDTTGQLYVDFSLMPTDKFEELLKSIHVPIWIGENGVGTEFYVNAATGTDTQAEGQGKSTSKPWASIAYATQTICQNYNINSREIHINVAGGTYTAEVSLPLQQRTTGDIVIRPIAGTGDVNIVRTVTSGGSAFVHSGGAWYLRDLNIKLVLGAQSYTDGFTFPHLVHSTDDTGAVTLTHCNLAFEDNTEPASAGTYGNVAARLLSVNGGHIVVRNVAQNSGGVPVDAQYESSWSGSIVNAAVTWIFGENGGAIELERPGSSALRAYGINVSGSFTTFCVLTQKAFFRNQGLGPNTVWQKANSPAGKQYDLQSGATISTGASTIAARDTYFPGDVAGTVEVGTYSWISPHEDYYAPNILFNPVPVYSVTLAEDVAFSSSSPYTIELGAAYPELWIVCSLPTALSVNCACYFKTATGDTLHGVLNTSSVLSACFSTKIHAARYSPGWGGTGSLVRKALYVVPVVPAFFAGDYSHVQLVPTAAATLPVGTVITIYGAQEV